MKVGILGGGQLARMLALSALPLGIEVICIDPKRDCCAKQITSVRHCDFSDIDQIEQYFQNVDCVTYETENLPVEWVDAISKKYHVLPGIDILKMTQDRLYEKDFFNHLNIPTTEYFQVETWEDLKKIIEIHYFPLVLKTRRNGYDGKGQMVIKSWDDAKNAWELMHSQQLIVEKFIKFDFEVSLVSARNNNGDVVFYPLTLNHHQDGILRVSEAPYLHDELQNKAIQYASAILEKTNYVGVMTIEFFCIENMLIANEIAPRVHNSGHWTIEGAETSQFENHLRAILGLPLGSTKANGFTTMINCIGNETKNINALLDISSLHFHTYGKKPMPNRKLGHITLCSNDKNVLDMNVKKALDCLMNDEYI